MKRIWQSLFIFALLAALLFSFCACEKTAPDDAVETTTAAPLEIDGTEADDPLWEHVEDETVLQMLSAYSAGHEGFQTSFTEKDAQTYLEDTFAWLSPACFTDVGYAMILDPHDAGAGSRFYRVYRTQDYGETWACATQDYGVSGNVNGIVCIDGTYWAYGFSSTYMTFFAARFAQHMKELPDTIYAQEEGEASIFDTTGPLCWKEISFDYDSDYHSYALEVGRFEEKDLDAPDAEPVETIVLRFNNDGEYIGWTAPGTWKSAEDKELRFLQAISVGQTGYVTPFSEETAATCLEELGGGEEYRPESVTSCFTPDGDAIVMRAVGAGAGQRFYRFDRTFDGGETWEFCEAGNLAGDVLGILRFENMFWAYGYSSPAEKYFIVCVGDRADEVPVQCFTTDSYSSEEWTVETLRYAGESGLFELVLRETASDGGEPATAIERFTVSGRNAAE